MAIWNILFMVCERSVKLLFLALLMAGCSGLKTRQDTRSETKFPAPGTPLIQTGSSSGNQSTFEEEDFESAPRPTEEPIFQSTSPQAKIPKVGLILGPGGARAYAQLGLLHELQKEKIPVAAVGGIEWGAVVAALYSNKGLANEAEWQLSKLKPNDVTSQSLIGGRSGPVSVREAQDFLKSAFGSLKAEEAKVPFACPAHHLAKNQIFLMSRGAYTQLLPFCLAYPPIFQPWQDNVSAIREVKMLADHLRLKGATTIVLVNVLGQPDPQKPIAGPVGSTESVLWNEIAAYYAKPLRGVDHILSVPLGRQSVLSFDESRGLTHQGSEKAGTLVKQLARKLGL